MKITQGFWEAWFNIAIGMAIGIILVGFIEQVIEIKAYPYIFILGLIHVLTVAVIGMNKKG